MTILGMTDYDLTQITDGEVLSGPMGDCVFVAGLSAESFWAQHCPGGLGGLEEDFFRQVPTAAHIYVVPGACASMWGSSLWEPTFLRLKGRYNNLMVFGKAPFAKLTSTGKLSRLNYSKQPM